MKQYLVLWLREVLNLFEKFPRARMQRDGRSRKVRIRKKKKKKRDRLEKRKGEKAETAGTRKR